MKPIKANKKPLFQILPNFLPKTNQTIRLGVQRCKLLCLSPNINPFIFKLFFAIKLKTSLSRA
jgi:hypothetical protein